jgi:hypothetical protein
LVEVVEVVEAAITPLAVEVVVPYSLTHLEPTLNSTQLPERP